MLLMKCPSTYMIKPEACYVTSQMKSLGFPTVVRVICPVVLKIILSLAHVVFTKAVDVKIQGTAANCVELASVIMCRLLNRSVGNTLQDFYRIVEAHDKAEPLLSLFFSVQSICTARKGSACRVDKIFVRREK